MVWYEKDRIGVRIWDSGEFVFTCAEAQEIVNKLSALLNLDTPNLPDPLLEAAKAILEWYGPIEADCMVALSKEVKAREKVTE